MITFLDFKKLIFLIILPFCFSESIMKPEHLQLIRKFQLTEVQRPIRSLSMDAVNRLSNLTYGPPALHRVLLNFSLQSQHMLDVNFS